MALQRSLKRSGLGNRVGQVLYFLLHVRIRVAVGTRNEFKFALVLQERIDHVRCKMRAPLRSDYLHRIGMADAFLVNLVADECIVNIGQRDNSCRQWNRIACKTPWITGAVPFQLRSLRHMRQNDK